MTFEPGEIVGERFEVITRLGGNRHGSTSKAKTISGDRAVAIKKLHREPDEGTELQLHKAQHAQQLSKMCDELMTIDEVEVHEQDVCCIMPFLPERSLRRHRAPDVSPKPKEEDAPLYFVEDFDWLIRVGAALDFLSEKGEIHGDVKPTNILFHKNKDDESTAYLSDIEIPFEPTKKPAGAMKDDYPGTIAYLAREVFLDRENLSARSDQYALAVTLYQWLAGVLPFNGTSGIDMYKAFQKGCKPISEFCPMLPQESSQALHRALSDEPDQRFDSSGEFVNEFVKSLATKRKQAWLQFSAAKARNIVFAVAAVLLALAGFNYFSNGQQSRAPSLASQVDEIAKPEIVPNIQLQPGAVSQGNKPGSNPALKNEATVRPPGLIPQSTVNGNQYTGKIQSHVSPSLSGAAADDTKSCPVNPQGRKETTAAPRIERKTFVDLHQRQSRKNDSPQAQFDMGMSFLRGSGKEANIKRAIPWLELAADQDMAEAHYQLARIYENPPTGYQQNSKAAVERYASAAKLGYANAQFRLGQENEQLAIQLRSQGPLNRDDRKRFGDLLRDAFSWYEKAANQNRPDLSLEVSRFFKRYGENELASQWQQRARDQLLQLQRRERDSNLHRPTNQKYEKLKDENLKFNPQKN
jgi:serine/threonine protein kinase